MMRLKRYLKNSVKSLLLIVSLSSYFIGCSIEKQEKKTTTAVEEKLINIFKENYKLDISTNLIGKTFWVYIPMEHDVLILDRASTLFNKERTQRFNVRYISGTYESKIFDFQFYIDQNPELPKMNDVFEGVTYDLTEKAAQININAHHYLEEIAWGYPEQIDFFVLVIADIKRGIEYSQTINALDLKKFSAGSLLAEEYSKRAISNIKGHQEIANNKDGSYLKYTDITLTDFIIKQVINRIRMDIPTKEITSLAADMNKIILETLWNAAKNYDFADFFMVKISNMVSGEVISYSKTAMDERFSGTAKELILEGI